jgi:hypothetical protein
MEQAKMERAQQWNQSTPTGLQRVTSGTTEDEYPRGEPMKVPHRVSSDIPDLDRGEKRGNKVEVVWSAARNRLRKILLVP